MIGELQTIGHCCRRHVAEHGGRTSGDRNELRHWLSRLLLQPLAKVARNNCHSLRSTLVTTWKHAACLAANQATNAMCTTAHSAVPQNAVPPCHIVLPASAAGYIALLARVICLCALEECGLEHGSSKAAQCCKAGGRGCVKLQV